MLPLFAVCLFLTGGIVVFTKMNDDVPRSEFEATPARAARSWTCGGRDLESPRPAGASPDHMLFDPGASGKGDRAPARKSVRQIADAMRHFPAPEYSLKTRGLPHAASGSPDQSPNPANDINLPLAYQIPERHLPGLPPADVMAVEAVQQQFADAMDNAPTQDPATPEYASYWNRERRNADDRLRQRLGHEGYNRFNSWVAQMAEQQRVGSELR
jgi:hypothetical protein